LEEKFVSPSSKKSILKTKKGFVSLYKKKVLYLLPTLITTPETPEQQKSKQPNATTSPNSPDHPYMSFFDIRFSFI